MKRSLSVTLLFFCLFASSIFLVNEADSMLSEPTHSIFIERFSNTKSPICLEEQNDIRLITEEWSHGFHLVDFHLQDEWSTFEATERATEFNITLVPSYVYDGGYKIRMGETLEKAIMEESAKRIVHKIGLSVDKEISEGEIKIECTVVERNGFPFNGEVTVYAVEDNLISGAEEWNNVFRDYAMVERVELKPNSHEIFLTEWNVPSNVNLENIKLVAVVFEVNRYGSYFVQSACDEDEEINIPEFASPAFSLVITSFIAIIIAGRIIRIRSGFPKMSRSTT